MKYYLIAGEASGDLHGSKLIQALTGEDPAAEFRAWGGDLMAAEGAVLVKHYRDLAFMGFAEVLRNIRTILRNIQFCKADILKYRPDALILIDYPGFNLRIAKWAKQKGLKVIYYISPQLWAWHSSRVHGIKSSIDKMFVILPFEKEFYTRYGLEVEFVGHPLLDVVDSKRESVQAQKSDENKPQEEPPVIALLPGSRKQEIQRMLPIMLELPQKFPDYRFVVAGAPAIPDSYYHTFIKEEHRVTLLQGKTYELLEKAFAAIVTSGTATLETALFGVPQVVCYRGGSLSFFIARMVVQVEHISLVNLILGRPLVKELVQDDCTPETVQQALKAILSGDKRQEVLQGYQQLREKLGNRGAAKRVATGILHFLNSSAPSNQTT